MRAGQALIVGVAAAFLALVALVFRGPQAREALPRPAPSFDLETLEGSRLRLAELAGRVVLLHFWATWCPPCVEETPALVRLEADLGRQGLQVIAVSVDEDGEAVRAFARRFGIRHAIARDPAGSTARRYGTYKYPESFLVDADGRIVRRWVGAVDWDSASVRAEIGARLAAVGGRRGG